MDFNNPSHPLLATDSFSPLRPNGVHPDQHTSSSTAAPRTYENGYTSNDDALAFGLCGLALVLSIGLLWFAGRKHSA